MVPLIYRYIFVHIKKNEYVRVLETPNVEGFVRFNKQIISIPDQEIEWLQRVSRPKINSSAATTMEPSTTSYVRMRRLNQNGSMIAVNMVLVAMHAAPMLAVLTLILP